MAKTAEVARDLHGAKLYQSRARLVLPILVRQARARQPLFYEVLAREVGMPNPRNLNYPLGCIGRTLNELAAEWDHEVPPIEALVVNQATRLPGPGFDGFLHEQGESWATKGERRALIEQYWAKIFVYPYWDDVVAELGLAPLKPIALNIIAAAAGAGGGGEGPDHLALKLFVSENPKFAGFDAVDATADVECPLPSGDCVDVVFFSSQRIHAVEVKPASSPPPDVTRGLFQCVKYRAVLKARAAYELDRRKITVCLVLGGSLPEELVPLRNSLNVDIYERVDAR